CPCPGAVEIGEATERECRQWRLDRGEGEATGADDSMEQTTDQLVQQFAFCREAVQRNRPGQLAHPPRRLATEIDVAARIVALPDVAQEAADNVQFTPGAVEFQRQQRLSGASGFVNKIDVPRLEGLSLPHVSPVDEAAAEDLPRRLLLRLV